MKATIIVTDVILRFRLAAIEQTSGQPQTWQLDVMTIEQVAHILVSLGFLDSQTAARLTEASTTITPQPGLNTVPVRGLRRPDRTRISRRRTAEPGSAGRFRSHRSRRNDRRGAGCDRLCVEVRWFASIKYMRLATIRRPSREMDERASIPYGV